MEKYSKLDGSILLKWDELMENSGFLKEVNINVRVIRDTTGKSNYTFGIIYNTYRFQRPNPINIDLCPLCEEVKLSEEKGENVLSYFPGFIVTPNKFPVLRGSCIAISTETAQNERPMYTTKNLDNLVEELKNVFKYADSTGFCVYHNCEGFGATLSRHEHWQLVNFGAAYDIAGEKYGFEKGDCDGLKKYRDVSVLSNFDFAHLIFNKNDPERLVSFLDNIQRELGNKFDKGFVPHCIAHGGDKVLVVPSKNYIKRGIGSGEIAGHFFSKSQEDFLAADFNFCINKLSERLFSIHEIALERFL